LDGLFLLPVLKSLPILFCAHSKPAKSECKQQPKELSQLNSDQLSIKSKLTKEPMDYIKD
jgi:hypothetical protein